jgi:3-phenylpropionate/cinnamic acid dioxygenase small subunit
MQMSEFSKDLSNRRLIEELVYRWAGARDSDDWDVLQSCFHDDAHIHISWISSSAEVFVGRSRAMAAARRPGAHMKHLMSGPWIETHGERGFCRSNALLLIRDCVDGAWFDIESHIRFFDRVEQRNGVWRLVDRTGVYDKDRLDAVEGAACMAPLAKYPNEARCLCWWLNAKGLDPVHNLITAYSQAERHLRNECLTWMYE